MAANVTSVRRPPSLRKSKLRSVRAILKGMRITHGHFIRNLWGVLRRKRTTFTVQYPEDRIVPAPALRGMPVLVQMDNGKERCVACGLCEWACPTDCITIFPAETADEVERYPEVFDINMSRCMYCGLCEEACPEEAIVMSHNIEIAALSRAGTLWHKQDLLTPVAKLERRLSHIRRGYDRVDAPPTSEPQEKSNV